MAHFTRKLMLSRALCQPLFTRCVSTATPLEVMRKPRWKGSPIPKPPGSPFVIYYKERYPVIQVDVPDTADIRKITQEKMRLAAGEWNQMTLEEKQMYEDKCKSEKDAYLEELKAFKDQLSKEDMAKLKKFKESLQNYRKEQKEIKAGTYIEKPKMRSGYQLFMSEFIKKKDSDTTSKDAMIMGAGAWKQLSDTEKTKFNNKAKSMFKAAQEEYEKALQLEIDG